MSRTVSELKAFSNTPLYGAFEILRYDLWCCHARRHVVQHREFIREHDRLAGLTEDLSHVLDAHWIDLIVLVPRAFYELPLHGIPQPFFLIDFASSINCGQTEVVASVPVWRR